MVSKRCLIFPRPFRGGYLVALFVWLLNGCAGHTEMQFYMLDAVVDETSAAPRHRSEKLLNVGLGPIRLPEYLDRPQIVVAVSQNQYRLDEFHRWAERLDENIERALAQFLSDKLGVEQVIRHPWSQKQGIDYQVSIDIFELHHAADGANRLKAQWQIRHQEQAPFSKRFDCAIPSDNDSEAIVRAQSQCLGRLGMDIVTELARMANSGVGGAGSR